MTQKDKIEQFTMEISVQLTCRKNVESFRHFSTFFDIIQNINDENNICHLDIDKFGHVGGNTPHQSFDMSLFLYTSK